MNTSYLSPVVTYLTGALLILGLMVTPTAFAKKPVTVLVLPFQINASQELAYLNESLPTMLAHQLHDRDIPTVASQDVMRILEEQHVTSLDLQTARDLALLSNAQYAVYGSFSQVGESLSLDVRLVEALGLKEPKAIFVVKKGLINLLPAIKELAEKIGQDLLSQEKIAAIKVEGTHILEKDVILMRLHIQKGDTYNPREVNQEVKRLFELGYFDDVRVTTADSMDGKVVTFEVKEKPLIQAIGVVGAKELDEDDILEVMHSKTGSVLNPIVLVEDMNAIRDLYRKKGYYNAKVSYHLESSETGRARLNITVEEGKELYIEGISIQGVKQLDPDDIEDELALSTRGMFSWLTGSGVLKEELLDRDAAAIEAYYGNRGFMDVKVGHPDVEYREDGIYITFKINEGKRYKVGKVRFSGDLITQMASLFHICKLDDLADDDGYFDRSLLRTDIQNLADFYTNYGYAYAEANADLKRNEDDLTFDVTYIMSKGQKVSIRQVNIQGNTKTRDNVIRREMRLTDGDFFSGAKLNRSNVRLTRLDYFETVAIETVPTRKPDQMDLVVKVKEKSTGMITAGAGYSTLDKLFFTASIKERNLFGKGYDTSFSGSFGASTTRYDITFWNPHFQDGKLGLGFQAYIKEMDYEDYDKTASGGRLLFGYPLGEYTRLSWNYRFERYTITDLDTTEFDHDEIKAGTFWASSAYVGATRDTTNRRINPNRGTRNTLSVEYSGGLLQGDNEFVKYLGDSSWYYPLFWDTVFHWHGQAGYIMKNGNNAIPLFERFYLGGINSVRGYKGRAISPRYDDTTRDKKGGTKELFTNVEYIFPISKEVGILGVLFFDAGNVWDDDETVDCNLYTSVGAGIRWYSPLGPLRLEYGYGLDHDDDVSGGGRVEFSVGQFF
ncbi:MAG: outer membrane protein assembly factor BamA [Deltaproteobacteria bacterium]|nr:MAG: outer membrane protein assembly factor BamA [Deltaproteobacteria bacterium]